MLQMQEKRMLKWVKLVFILLTFLVQDTATKFDDSTKIAPTSKALDEIDEATTTPSVCALEIALAGADQRNITPLDGKSGVPIDIATLTSSGVVEPVADAVSHGGSVPCCLRGRAFNPSVQVLHLRVGLPLRTSPAVRRIDPRTSTRTSRPSNTRTRRELTLLLVSLDDNRSTSTCSMLAAMTRKAMKHAGVKYNAMHKHSIVANIFESEEIKIRVCASALKIEQSRFIFSLCCDAQLAAAENVPNRTINKNKIIIFAPKYPQNGVSAQVLTKLSLAVLLVVQQLEDKERATALLVLPQWWMRKIITPTKNGIFPKENNNVTKVQKPNLLLLIKITLIIKQKKKRQKQMTSSYNDNSSNSDSNHAGCTWIMVQTKSTMLTDQIISKAQSKEDWALNMEPKHTSDRTKMLIKMLSKNSQIKAAEKAGHGKPAETPQCLLILPNMPQIAAQARKMKLSLQKMQQESED